MSEFNGTKLRVYTQATPAKIDMETDLELAFNSDSKSFRNKDSGNWRELLEGAGELSADLNFNFHVDITSSAANSLEALWDDWVAGNLIDIKIATEETGWLYYTGKFKITDLKITAADQEVVEGSCSMQSSGEVSKSGGTYTPADLGAKLLDQWVSQINTVDGSGDVTALPDQKGSIDFAPGTAPHYDSVNKKIDFDSASSEYLQSNANAASINRSSGQYWFVINHTTGVDQILICKSKSTSSTDFIMLQIVNNHVRLLAKSGIIPPINIEGTTALVSGKNIISFKSDGSAFIVKLNNVDISSEFSTGGGEWEDYAVAAPDRLSIAMIDYSPGSVNTQSYKDTSIYEIHRTDGTLTSTQETNNYNYLNAKY